MRDLFGEWEDRWWPKPLAARSSAPRLPPSRPSWRRSTGPLRPLDPEPPQAVRLLGVHRAFGHPPRRQRRDLPHRVHRRCWAASGVSPPTCGVATTPGRRASPGVGIWSGARPTSRAAPARRPEFSAARAPPRPPLAPRQIQEKCAAPHAGEGVPVHQPLGLRRGHREADDEIRLPRAIRVGPPARCPRPRRGRAGRRPAPAC